MVASLSGAGITALTMTPFDVVKGKIKNWKTFLPHIEFKPEGTLRNGEKPSARGQKSKLFFSSGNLRWVAWTTYIISDFDLVL